MTGALDLRILAANLGGEVSNGQVVAPGPGHKSPSDRSLAVRLSPDAPDGFVVHSFAGDDPMQCRDHVRAMSGLAAWQPGTSGRSAIERMGARVAANGNAAPAPVEARPFSDGHLIRRGYSLVATYDYAAEDGALLYQVLRYEHPSEPKTFLQRRPDGNGGWLSGSGDRRVPYRMGGRLKVAHTTVWVTEGEKDADRLASHGLTATTAASGKWTPDMAAVFAGHDLLILEDNDKAGREKAAKTFKALEGVADSVRIIRLPGLPEGGDVTDWLDAGNTVEALIEAGRAADQPTTPADPPSPRRPSPNAAGSILTEDSAALRFTDRHRNDLRFCHSSGGWFRWDGVIWRKDGTGAAFNFARQLVRDLAAEHDTKTAIVGGKAAFAGSVERFARCDPAHARTADDWDKNPMILGTPGGLVDLATGKLGKSDPAAGVTKVTAVAPSREADCPLWRRFLSDATGGDAGMIRFLQQWAGYCLSGDTREHALVFVFGEGGNGKSVFLNTLTGILGDYAAIAAMDTFTASHGDKHPTDLAMLRGARLVTASETEEGRAWAESRIKQMTGGDPVTARFMRQDFFTYRPQFKLTIIGNHKPVLRNVDDAARRRFNIVPFILKPANPDRELEAKLKAEWPAILRWMIEGCLDWQTNGLVRPAALTDATATYFEDQDLQGQWLADECDTEPGNPHKSEGVTALFKSWKAYAERAGENGGNVKSFSETMQRRGFERRHTRSGRVFHGVCFAASVKGEGW